MANNQNQERKDYSFLNMKRCVGREGNNFIGVTVQGFVNKYSNLRQTSTGRTVCDFSLPINNRTKYLASMLGGEIYEKDGTVWAKVTLWDSPDEKGQKLASRFDSYMQKHPSCIVMITGAIKIDEREDNGRTYRNVVITADDFSPVRDTKGGNSNNSGASAAPNAAPASAPDFPGMGDFQDFDDLDDDGKLPF